MPLFLFSSTQGKRIGVLSKKIKRTRFSMLNFRAQKTMQSELVTLNPFLSMGFFLNNFGTTIA
tara:strand:- start:1210 stop:1398 length:189 start_codon:yes stop_codon:yes gene_type:complete